MDGQKADMVYCDPPYAVGVSTTGIQSSLADLKILRPFFRDWLVCMANAIEPGAHWYIATDWRTYPLIFEDVARYGLTNVIVWDYDWIKAGAQYRFRYELIMFGTWGATKWKVPRDEPDVWQIKAENFTVERLHGAQKPTSLIERMIGNSCWAIGGSVLDLFGGSGSTLIAAEQTARIAYLMEVDPGYCDVIVNRWQTLTGRKAVLDGKAVTA
jgi:DNA modification methylase